MRRHMLTVMTVLLLGLIGGPAQAAMTIKLGLVTKPGSAQNIVADKFKELVKERSKGAIEVKVYHSASLGNETEILQQIQMNTVQMGWPGDYHRFFVITEFHSFGHSNPDRFSRI